MVPVLELDSGVAITDIIAICRYFEELHPDPPLMGRSAEIPYADAGKTN